MYKYSYKEKQRRNNKFRDYLKDNITESESLMKNAFDELWIRYLFQKWFIKWDAHYIIDFYLPRYKLCIEVDWPCHDYTKEYDNRKDSYLRWRWFSIIRIKNEHVNDFIKNIKSNGL